MHRNFIPQNRALPGIRRLGVYNAAGHRVGQIPLGSLTPPDGSRKLYSFGALADIHLPVDTAQSDFRRALDSLAGRVDFVTVCGDLTQNGLESEFALYRDIAAAAPMPVFAAAGNHEAWNPEGLEQNMHTYAGRPLQYCFAWGEDIFLMLSVRGDSENGLFTQAQLQWLQAALEEHRNRRCFLFQHVRPQTGCGNAWGIYSYDIWGGAEAEIFESLLRHYPNVIFFHGHSHLSLKLQTRDNQANYDRRFGVHSVHVPSVTAPRTGDATGAGSLRELQGESEGYVVDVYDQGVRLLGLDFQAGAPLALASYWLDTPVQPVAGGTYPAQTIVK